MPGKSLAQKLLIKQGHKVLLLNPPQGYLATLQAECPEAMVSEKRSGVPDVVQVFVTSDAALKGHLPSTKKLVSPKSLLWVTYPKGTSKMRSDVNRDTIRTYAETI